VPVRLLLLELAVVFQPLDHALVGFLLPEPGKLAGILVHAAVGGDHRQLRQVVVDPDLVVERVVAGGHLQRARAEILLHPLVGDDRDAPLDEGHDHFTADEVAVALVIRVHCDCNVRKNRRRPHRRDGDVAVAVCERIANVGQDVVHLDVLELEVRQRRPMERAPVDDPVRSVNPALAIEVDEEAHYRADVRVVHGEALATVVERGAHAAKLEHDLAAVLAQPVPHECDEGFASELLAALPLLREVPLDGVLRRDPSMVESGLEERVVPLHPPGANDRVGERELECVAEMEVAGDVRRRVGDREALSGGIGVRIVVALFLPGPLPALFDPFGLVARIHLARDPSLAPKAGQWTGEITQRLWAGV
jgi:hypothetical protein